MRSQIYCAECMNTIEGQELYNDEGNPICEACFYDQFITCEDCDDVIARDDSISIDGGHVYVCESCAESHYYCCDDCGEYVSTRHLWADRNMTICDFCSDNYCICEDCGAVIHSENIHYIDGEYYCDDCEPSHRNVIRDYDYKPLPEFYGKLSERVKGYYGIELEVDNGENCEDAAKAILRCAGDFLYLKHDGSLNYGFEIVSHPATLDFHMTEFPWSAILSAAEKYEFKSHDTDTCGLHIHASREMFGNSEIERDLTVAKCMLLIDAYWDEYVVPFSRRKYEKLEEWARKPNSGISANDLEEIAIEKAREKAKEGRYQAINLQNYNTVEFRFFRGTLRRDTIIASIQFVDTLINYAKNTQLKDLFKKSFLEIFSNSERPELVEYLKRRNILKEDK